MSTLNHLSTLVRARNSAAGTTVVEIPLGLKLFVYATLIPVVALLWKAAF